MKKAIFPFEKVFAVSIYGAVSGNLRRTGFGNTAIAT